MTPLVSSIIPACNAEFTIVRCVESVLNQSWENLEIIIIEDGSKDRTGEVLRKMERIWEQQGKTGCFKNSGRSLNILEQENHGVSFSRHRGLELARGEYVTFLDADDYIEVDYIAAFVRAAEAEHAEVCLCGYTEVSENGERRREHSPLDGYDRYERGTSEEYAYHMLSTCARFYRTEFCRKHDIPMVMPGDVRGEDIPAGLRANYFCEKVCIVDQCGYYYVQRAESARHRMRGLRNYRLPLDEIESVVRECAAEHALRTAKETSKETAEEKGHWQYFELGIVRVFITFLWDLGRGADREDKRTVFQWASRILEDELADYKENPKLMSLTKTKAPLHQRAAVWLFMHLFCMGSLRRHYE